ncbi:hypothetical protein NAEGRDRAFT_29311 [Naegleria gruberi]|uniref:Actin n=1 Tax=Naegleria gruberi TaxID=5762 RepID=D2UYT9_NAEGR|nr:uncharacterized protein NAEGRDRAFT_29311 [Naegleria gruberi]EFC50844.1 hypothetical protein NAEGRDRAFT_29311 [Naegleria gruberi]|eukprot:XP_002683588.1 hypothetical protein NAEGRDRAFT_29311 [Naegleria gruberi strain NEG-M]
MPLSDNVLGGSSDEGSEYDNPPPVVIDFGSGVFKAGIAGEEIPSCCFQNVVGLPHLDDENEYLNEEFLVGDKALDQRHSHQLFYPMDKGQVEDWEQIEFLIEYALLDVLDVEPEDTLLLITDNPMSTKKEKEKMAECLFELFLIPGLCYMPQPLLSLYSVGKTTGLVIDSGDCVSHTVPVFEGFIIDHAMNHLDFGGRDVTHYLQRMLYSKGYRFASSSEHHFVREIKESFAYVSQNFEKEKKKPYSEIKKDYELPDGQIITLDEELFACTELLFNPSLMGKDAPGLAELVFDTFKASPIDVRKDFYNSIVLSGGNTLFNGFKERIKLELENNEKSFKPFKVLADPMRQFSAWMGGSVIASLPTFEDAVVTYEDWEDYGPRSLYQKKSNFNL